MRKSKFSESQIVSFLKEAEAERKVSEIYYRDTPKLSGEHGGDYTVTWA